MGVHFHYRSIVQPEKLSLALKTGLVENEFCEFWQVSSQSILNACCLPIMCAVNRESHISISMTRYWLYYFYFQRTHVGSHERAIFTMKALKYLDLTWSSVGISSTAAAARLILEKEKQKVVGEGERGAEQLKKTKTKINWCLTWLTVNSLLFSETLMCDVVLRSRVYAPQLTLSRLIGDRWCWHKESFVHAAMSSLFGEVNLIARIRYSNKTFSLSRILKDL